MTKKAVVCPLCGGKGKMTYPKNHFTDTNPERNDCGNPILVCHGCNGKGWVEVSAE